MKDFQESINSTIWSPGSHHGSVHSSTLVYFKKKPSPWNFQGHLSAPDLGLACSNLPCDLRMRARTPTKTSVSGWLAPSCASFPARTLRCSPSAWRLEMAPLVRHYKPAARVSGNLCSQCSMQTAMYYPYQYQSHGFCGLPTSTRKTSGNSMGAPEMSYFHSACRYTMGLICENSRQFCHIMFILPVTTMKCGWRAQQRITLMSRVIKINLC